MKNDFGGFVGTSETNMQLDPRDAQFIAETLPTIEGWLPDDAAILTSALIRWQQEIGVSGGVFEIGVFAGKYLSLLYHLTRQTDHRVLGVDTFQWCPREKVEGNFNRVFVQPDRLVLWAEDSTRIAPVQVVERLGCKPRFISVDGAHTAVAVLSDLMICEQILADGGIVAIDDVMNPHAFGVGEGAYRYFLNRDSQGLVPFAFGANKLYAAHHRDVKRCHEAAWEFTRSNPGLKVTDDFNKLLEKGRDWVQQDLFGFPVVIL
jgi:hypothetical protein